MQFFIKGNSFAAPFASDPVERYVEADNPLDAIEKFVKSFKHPAGLYFASAYGSADDYHKNNQPLYNVWSKKAEYAWNNEEVPNGVDEKELVFSAEKMRTT